jgi:disulfide bond formation protein DsbB
MSPELGRKLNVLFVLAVTLILLGAYGVQFGAGELPCPLCLLQRLAMLGVGTGAALNVLYGVRPRHYGLSLASAIFGGIVAGRQVLLHIQPGDPGFGAPVFGLHLYTWSFIAFLCIALVHAMMLCLDRQFAPIETTSPPLPLTRAASSVLALFLFVAVANVATTFLLCGLGPCPDNPTHYRWWS